MVAVAVLIVLIVVIFVLIGVNGYSSKNKHERVSQETIKGKQGEAYIHSILKQLPVDYTVFDDVVLRTASGTTQIDHVVVSKYGVFAIETKNYRGEIYGDDYRQEWKQIIVRNVRFRKNWWKTYSYVTKNNFYNPVMQSEAHANAIKKALIDWPNLKVVPIVVFAGSAVLNGVNTQHHVVYSGQLLATIQSYNIPLISDAVVDQVKYCLIWKNVRGQVDDRTHISNVYAAKQSYNEKIASGICPQCGGKLVLRKGKYGSFYGCQNYPQCRWTLR